MSIQFTYYSVLGSFSFVKMEQKKGYNKWNFFSRRRNKKPTTKKTQWMMLLTIQITTVFQNEGSIIMCMLQHPQSQEKWMKKESLAICLRLYVK